MDCTNIFSVFFRSVNYVHTRRYLSVKKERSQAWRMIQQFSRCVYPTHTHTVSFSYLWSSAPPLILSRRRDPVFTRVVGFFFFFKERTVLLRYFVTRSRSIIKSLCFSSSSSFFSLEYLTRLLLSVKIRQKIISAIRLAKQSWYSISMANSVEN